MRRKCVRVRACARVCVSVGTTNLFPCRYLLPFAGLRGATASIELEQERAFVVQVVHVCQPHAHASSAQTRHLGAYVKVVELLLGHLSCAVCVWRAQAECDDEISLPTQK